MGRDILPAGGATIAVNAQGELASRDGRESLQGWAERDADPGNPETVKEARVSLPDATGIASAISTSFDLKRYSADEQSQHEVNIYWSFQGNLFAAHLLYVATDPKAAKYETTLHSLIEGMRPIGSR
jgi:hypothetical protein